LSTLQKGELFRLNAPSRFATRLHPTVEKFSLKNDRNIFNVPPLAQLKKFRVVVSTCASSAVPYNIGFPRGHFSHIFVDEAGQACEPEVMIGIKTLSDNKTNVILSGDPKQLGPIIRSSIARELGMTKSYLDRLMESEAYQSEYSGITYVSHASLSNLLTSCQCRQAVEELAIPQCDLEVLK
jgi:helicase MOV-10